MDKTTKIFAVAGIVITLAPFFFNIYAAGIAFILVIVIIMSLLIMQDRMDMPEISASLREDARAVLIRNTGNSPALKIHVALVPADTEFDLPVLAADESHEHILQGMINEVKVVVTFENKNCKQFARSFRLSALGDYDPLKPMIPFFKWKNNRALILFRRR